MSPTGWQNNKDYDELIDDLEASKSGIARLLAYHQDAADISLKIEEGHIHVEELEEFDENSFVHVLMDTYRRCVPAGIAQRETENEEIEEEFIEMDTNRLGHLL